MNKYQNGKIYTIRCYDNSDLVYVGSTIQPLYQRWSNHKVHSREPHRQHLSLYSSINNEWDKWYIELYENCPCENKEQLLRREGEVIRLIGTLNCKISGRTDKEYRKDNRIQETERNRKWLEENSHKIQEYYNKHRQSSIERAKIWNENHLETRKQKFDCCCGGKYTYSHKASHIKSKVHQSWLKNNVV